MEGFVFWLSSPIASLMSRNTAKPVKGLGFTFNMKELTGNYIFKQESIRNINVSFQPTCQNHSLLSYQQTLCNHLILYNFSI